MIFFLQNQEKSMENFRELFFWSSIYLCGFFRSSLDLTSFLSVNFFTISWLLFYQFVSQRLVQFCSINLLFYVTQLLCNQYMFFLSVCFSSIGLPSGNFFTICWLLFYQFVSLRLVYFCSINLLFFILLSFFVMNLFFSISQLCFYWFTSFLSGNLFAICCLLFY